MMSSSEHHPQGAPSPWALDELEMPEDVFPALRYDGVADADEEADAASATDHVVDALVAARLSELRARLEAEAFARGHAAGVEEATNTGREMITRVAAALGDAVALVQAHEHKWLSNVEENLAAVAVGIARHILLQEVNAHPEYVAQLVSNALQQFPLDRQVTVRLHPDDLAVVRETLPENELHGPRGREIRWQADASIVRGGCMVEGRERVLDGRIDTALERAYRTIGQAQA